MITFKHEVKEELEATLSDAETDTQTEPSHSPDTKLTIEESLDVHDEEEEELCHEVASLLLSEGMKRKLELDHAMVNKRRKLVHLPAQPNIVRNSGPTALCSFVSALCSLLSLLLSLL